MGNHSYRIVYRRAGPRGTPPRRHVAAAGGEETLPADLQGWPRFARQHMERDRRAEPGPASGSGRMFCGLASAAPRRATGIARGASESTSARAARPLDVRGATGGRGIGWPGPAFRQGARVRGERPLEYLAGSNRNENPGRSRDRYCGGRKGGLTRARARRRRRWRRRSRPSGRALARQPVPTRHEGGS